MNVWVVQSPTIPWCIHITQHMCKCVLGIHFQSRIACHWDVHLQCFWMEPPGLRGGCPVNFRSRASLSILKSPHKEQPDTSDHSSPTLPSTLPCPYSSGKGACVLCCSHCSLSSACTPILLLFKDHRDSVEKPGGHGSARFCVCGPCPSHWEARPPSRPSLENVRCPPEETWKMPKCSEEGVVPNLYGPCPT